MALHLTDKLVRELPAPAQGNKITYDDEVAGLGVRVTAAGARAYIFNYRVRATGKERRITIGDATNEAGDTVLKIGAARDKAETLRQRVRDGEDPMGKLHADRAAPTVADLATRYLEYAQGGAKPLRARTFTENKALIDRVIVPTLGGEKVAALTRDDVKRLFNKVSKQTPIRANRMLSVLRRMLNLAETEFKMRTGPNPATAIDRNPEERRTRYLEPEELARLLAAIGNHRNQQSANIVRLALLTGARRGEILQATWPQFSAGFTTWTKPASLTKQKKLHSIPLNGPARELLAGMKAAADQENARRAKDGLPALVHLFPGHGGNDAQGDLKRTWAAICEAAGIGTLVPTIDEAGKPVKGPDGKPKTRWQSDLRFHDLRHSFASFLASSGHNLPLIGQMLGHSSPATTQRYAHLLLDPQREAAERVGAIIAGGDSAKVVPMPVGRRA
ncbi:MAG TPA: site-specific integrase [Acetobacteraceae bacterium]|nr:site-specific integrase [Acetobacteraceae bacterium]